MMTVNIVRPSMYLYENMIISYNEYNVVPTRYNLQDCNAIRLE